jgi:hypothetical protein
MFVFDGGKLEILWVMETNNLSNSNFILQYFIELPQKTNGIKSFLFIPSLVAGAGLEPTTFGL